MMRGSAANGVQQGRRWRGKRVSAAGAARWRHVRGAQNAVAASWRRPWRQLRTRAAAKRRNVIGRTAASFFRQTGF
jgi:hypothetical protein